jgi:hypothetical protein
MTEEIVDSVTAAEMLGITQNNLRQLFTLANVEQVKAARTTAIPSA